MAEKLELLRRVSEEAKKGPKVFSSNATLSLRSEDKYFASTEGSSIQQLDFPDLRQRGCHRGGPREQHFAHAQLHAHAGLGGLGIRAGDEPGRERAAHSRGSGGAPHRAAREARQEGPAADAEPPDADDSRERRASHRTRSRAGLRGQLRRHQLHHAGQDRQAHRERTLHVRRRPDLAARARPPWATTTKA